MSELMVFSALTYRLLIAFYHMRVSQNKEMKKDQERIFHFWKKFMNSPEEKE